VPIASYSQNIEYARVPEKMLRQWAIKAVMPNFPIQAKEHRIEGVAVVGIEINTSGNIEKVEVLQAPDQSISEVVMSAVKQWQFKIPPVDNRSVRVKSKLTFYFVIDGASARVENPRKIIQ